MFKVLIALGICLSINSFAASTYPLNPDPRLTPGSFCQHPDSHRYPQKIAYCERHVSKETKWNVIRTYNRELNYNIDSRDRGQFKIDHLIPLCAGGSNQLDNLWPQHSSVYNITDPLEPLICEKMAAGRLLQKRAIELLMRAKMHLEEAPAIYKIIENL